MAYCGLPGQSVAVEFDIYPNYGTQTRNDPSNNYNHIAIVKAISEHNGPTYAGTYGENSHNFGGNPACSLTVNPPSPTCNGTCSGLCTGTCNGSAINNSACAGTCIGSCSGTNTCTWTGLASNGNCSGNNTCFGTCDDNPTANGGTTCAGTCYGACTGANYDSIGSCGGAACFYNTFGNNNFPIPHINAATWLEDNTTHNARVEIHTRCNLGCSTCDTTTTSCSPTPAAPGKALVKVWIDKNNNIINSDEPSTPDVSYCLDLPAAMNLVKMGFTQGTGASVQMGTLTNLNANFFGSCPLPSIAASPLIPNGYRTGSSFPTTTFSASGGTAPYSNWVFQGTTPTGTSVASAATFATTPKITGGTLNTNGSYNFAVSVADSCSIDGGTNCNKIAQTKFYAVNVCPALSITTTSPLPNGHVGNSYSKTIVSSGGTAPITWTATGLPTGLSLNSSTGVISGTPTATGTSNVTITATDTCGSTVAVAKIFSLQI